MSDIIVIGGGIAGLSAGARLSVSATVTVLEAETALGYHASGRSAALFEPNYGSVSTVALSRASADYHHNANGGYLSPRGLLIVGEAHQRADFDRDVADLGVDPISPQEALAMVPILDRNKVALAGYHADAQDIDTDRMLQDFARQIRANGGAVLTGRRVGSIARENGRWRVACGPQVLEAATLVNAAGAWADQVARMAGARPLGIAPHRRSMARLPAPGGHDVSRWPMFFGVNESWYAKPDAGALIVSPADADPQEPQDAWADDMVLAEGLARYESMVTEPVTRMLGNWAGLRSFAPDRCLVLGRDVRLPEFVWCAGQGGYGFQTAPAASRFVADTVLGRPPEIDAATAAALSPGRFG